MYMLTDNHAALSDGALGPQVLEMTTGGLHVHDEKIPEVQSNVVSIGSGAKDKQVGSRHA